MSNLTVVFEPCAATDLRNIVKTIVGGHDVAIRKLRREQYRQVS
jgi:hypothetical protein